MHSFMIDLHNISLPMKMIKICLIKDSLYKEKKDFQHRHNLFELQYVLYGHGDVRIGEKLYTLQQNNVYLISPGIYHSQKSCSSQFKKICIVFEMPHTIEPDNKTAEQVHKALRSVNFFSCSAQKMKNNFICLADALLDYENRTCGIAELRITAELLILQIAQQINSSGKSAPQKEYYLDQRVYIIDEFFNHNFYRNDGDVLLAKKLGVSIRQLNRILKNLYGHNFREKLLEIRLEVAMDLLAADKSIAEISEITGYSCPANFSTFIKKSTGKTPSELKRLKRSDGSISKTQLLKNN